MDESHSLVCLCAANGLCRYSLCSVALALSAIPRRKSAQRRSHTSASRLPCKNTQQCTATWFMGYSVWTFLILWVMPQHIYNLLHAHFRFKTADITMQLNPFETPSALAWWQLSRTSNNFIPFLKRYLAHLAYVHELQNAACSTAALL
jgi:hypothetical protein